MGAASSFMALLKEKEIKYDVDYRDTDTVVTISFGMKNTSLTINLFIDGDETHVALRCFDYLKVSEDKLANVLMVCNQCNKEYRWIKFVLDDDCVNGQTDAIVSADSAGEELLELTIRLLNILDECYPTFMKALWG